MMILSRERKDGKNIPNRVVNAPDVDFECVPPALGVLVTQLCIRGGIAKTNCASLY